MGTNIAVVDSGGVLVAHIRQDGAWIGSVDVAINKAFSARAFDVSTQALGENVQPGGQFNGIHDSNHGRVMIFGGGVPLMSGDEVIGAVGVSGGTGEQDQAVAAAAAAALWRPSGRRDAAGPESGLVARGRPLRPVRRGRPARRRADDLGHTAGDMEPTGVRGP